jgi:hypothetical protein
VLRVKTKSTPSFRDSAQVDVPGVLPERARLGARPRDLQRLSDEARRSGRSGVLRPPVDPASPRDHADVCARTARDARMRDDFRGRSASYLQMLLARMSPGQ